MYILDGMLRVRFVTAAGVVTTVAGSGTAGAAVDGTGTQVVFNAPQALTVLGGLVFICDTSNNLIRVMCVVLKALLTLVSLDKSAAVKVATVGPAGIGVLARLLLSSTPQQDEEVLMYASSWRT